jgi:hypothetical protein
MRMRKRKPSDVMLQMVGVKAKPKYDVETINLLKYQNICQNIRIYTIAFQHNLKINVYMTKHV